MCNQMRRDRTRGFTLIEKKTREVEVLPKDEEPAVSED